MNETENKLKRIKVDSLYGKKKHFKAADRIQNYHYWLGIPLVLINLITSSVLFYVISDGKNTWVKYVPLIFALVASLLGGLQTFFNYSRQVEGHRRIGNKYLSIMKKCDRLQGYIKDEIIDKSKISEILEEIAEAIDSVNQEAEGFPTNQKDYELAKKGINDGEENYTETFSAH